MKAKPPRLVKRGAPHRGVALLWCSLCLLVSGCGSSAPPPNPARGQDTCAVAVLSSDYAVSALSLLNTDGSPCIDPLVSSGSAPVGLVTALSGDVVLVAESGPEHALVLIDRFPNATLTYVSGPPYRVSFQANVSTGFASNPHGIARLDDGRYYVTRYERNASASAALDDFDEGADLLIMAPDGQTLVGRVALSDPEVTNVNPRPSQIEVIGEHVWVTLGNLSDDFSSGSAGEVVLVSAVDDVVEVRYTIEGFANCGGLVRAYDGSGAWVSCSGVFADGPERQLERSGLVKLSWTDGGVVEEVRYRASDLSDSPLSPNVVVTGPSRVVVSTYGSLTPEEVPDRLIYIDALNDSVNELAVDATPFGLGGLLWRPSRSELWVCDGNPERPGVIRLPYRDGVFDAGSRVFESSATGLPPRQVVELEPPP